MNKPDSKFIWTPSWAVSVLAFICWVAVLSLVICSIWAHGIDQTHLLQCAGVVGIPGIITSLVSMAASDWFEEFWNS